MYKAILFDIDGILIKPPHFYTDDMEKSGYKNASSTLYRYYRSKEDQLCCEGKLNIEETVQPYLLEIGWERPSTDYLYELYNFEKEYLDNEIIDLIEKLQAKGIICCIATDQNKHRADFLLNQLDFKNIFDYHFISSSIGSRKIQQGFWRYVIDFFNDRHPEISPEDMIFYDDRSSNLKFALEYSIQGKLVDDHFDLKKELQSFLS